MDTQSTLQNLKLLNFVTRIIVSLIPIEQVYNQNYCTTAVFVLEKYSSTASKSDDWKHLPNGSIRTLLLRIRIYN